MNEHVCDNPEQDHGQPEPQSISVVSREVVQTIHGTMLQMRTPDGGLVVVPVDAARCKAVWREMQRRVGMLSPAGMQGFANRMDPLFMDLMTWADEPTKELAVQVGSVLAGYKPGLNFKAVKRLLQAAVSKTFAEVAAKMTGGR